MGLARTLGHKYSCWFLMRETNKAIYLSSHLSCQSFPPNSYAIVTTNSVQKAPRGLLDGNMYGVPGEEFSVGH